MTLLAVAAAAQSDTAEQLADEANAALNQVYATEREGRETQIAALRALRVVLDKIDRASASDTSIRQDADIITLRSTMGNVLSTRSRDLGIDASTLEPGKPTLVAPPGATIEGSSSGTTARVKTIPELRAWTVEGMVDRAPAEKNELNRWLQTYHSIFVHGSEWLRNEVSQVEENGTDPAKWRAYYASRLVDVLKKYEQVGELTEKRREQLEFDKVVADFVRAELETVIDDVPTEKEALAKWAANLPAEFLRGVDGLPQDFAEHRPLTLAGTIVRGLGIQSLATSLAWTKTSTIEDLDERHRKAQYDYRVHLLEAHEESWWTRERTREWDAKRQELGATLFDVERTIVFVSGADLRGGKRDEFQRKFFAAADYKTFESLQKAEFNAWLLYRYQRHQLGKQGNVFGPGVEPLVKQDTELRMDKARAGYQDSENRRKQSMVEYIKSIERWSGDPIVNGLKVTSATMKKFTVHDDRPGEKRSVETFYKKILGWEKYKDHYENHKYFRYHGAQDGYQDLLTPEEFAVVQEQSAFRAKVLRRQ
jgi:hypothetical protein